MECITINIYMYDMSMIYVYTDEHDMYSLKTWNLTFPRNQIQ